LNEDGLALLRRGSIGIVFQSFHLVPTMTALENVAIPLELAGRDDAFERSREALASVSLDHRLTHYPGQLSGGEQQRVALVRALATSPGLLLLDEPLSALDAKVRAHLRREIRDLQKRLGVTTVMVTHDQEEALSMSDTICIMLEGRIVQTGGPRELYDEPTNHYVAGFVGKSNFFGGVVVETNDEGAALRLSSGRVLKGRVTRGGSVPGRDRQAKLAVRPELVHIAAVNGTAAFSTDVETSARVKNRIFLGELTEYLVEADGLGDILIHASKHAEGISGGFSPGDVVRVGWDDASALAFEETIDWDRSTVGAAAANNQDGAANKGD